MNVINFSTHPQQIKDALFSNRDTILQTEKPIDSTAFSQSDIVDKTIFACV